MGRHGLLPVLWGLESAHNPQSPIRMLLRPRDPPPYPMSRTLPVIDVNTWGVTIWLTRQLFHWFPHWFSADQNENEIIRTASLEVAKKFETPVTLGFYLLGFVPSAFGFGAAFVVPLALFWGVAAESFSTVLHTGQLLAMQNEKGELLLSFRSFQTWKERVSAWPNLFRHDFSFHGWFYLISTVILTVAPAFKLHLSLTAPSFFCVSSLILLCGAYHQAGFSHGERNRRSIEDQSDVDWLANWMVAIMNKDLTGLSVSQELDVAHFGQAHNDPDAQRMARIDERIFQPEFQERLAAAIREKLAVSTKIHRPYGT